MSRMLLPGLLLAIGVVLVAGGAALAFGGDGDPDEDLLADVAERLGLEPSEVQEAFAQAQREQADERVGESLSRLVESGRITQEQSDEALEWFQARPDSASKLPVLGLAGVLSKRGLGFGGPMFAVPGHRSSYLHGLDIPADIRERMAQALGVEIDELERAFSEAASDAAVQGHLDAIRDHIDRLVEKDVITQEQGDELKAWVDEMPAWLAKGRLHGALLDGGAWDLDVPELREFRGFEAPGHDVTPRFRFEFRPHRFPFRPGLEAPADPTPTPADAATGVSRSA